MIQIDSQIKQVCLSKQNWRFKMAGKQILSTIFVAFVFFAAAVGHAATWDVDKVHSSVGFSVRHMMVSTVRGEFTSYQATAEFDPTDPPKLSVEATIDAASISTRNDARDKHLRSADFFDVEKFPQITFKSTKAVRVAEGKYRVTGDLTIHGITKEITLEGEGFSNTIKDSGGNIRTGATATATISRKDFGLLWNAALEAGGVVVGDEVTIDLEIELTQRAP
jgi:polyisoprenoid-binding protein YceI